ncbi:hypothetical protein HNY73_004413 [Argiope bruennichi]|uniref:Uncharacterized protein n=1 Tax=Argiope bruennichi TaxID=94029 RepID=A0A8T0FPW6_ARGBR|nr:hypothetical protein HNY73_004413 [Argiope bruennichi]
MHSLYQKTLEEFREWIRSAIMTIERMALRNLCNEFNYRLNVCHVTKHIKLGHIQDLFYALPLPKTLEEFREWIRSAIMTIERMALRNLCNEFNYRLNVCHVTKTIKLGLRLGVYSMHQNQQFEVGSKLHNRVHI